MPHQSPAALIRAGERAWSRKRQWFGLFHEVWRYAAPGMDPWTGARADMGVQQGGQGQPRHNHLFDSTLARSVVKHANRMVSEIFPAGRDWAQLAAGPLFGGDGDDRSKAIMAVLQAKVFQAIHASNFNLAANSMVFDGVTSGTGCMKVGLSADSSTLLDFEAVNQSQVAFLHGPRGAVWGFFRKMEHERDHIRALWPGADLPDMEDEEDGAPKRYELLECVTYAPDEGVWHYDVILVNAEGASQDGRRIYEREYVVCPWLVWRYMLMPGEVQGRSPAMAALPDARTANNAVRVRLESASMRVAGMWTYRAEDVFNPRTTHMRSGTFLPVGSNDTTNPTIRALELAGDPQMGELVLEDTRNSIRETMLDLSLPEPAGAVRSATEIIERQRENMQQLGQPFLRLGEEVGRPILRAVAYLLAEAGQLEELAPLQPPDPNSGQPAPLMLDGRDVSVSFTSPLVQAQRLSDAETVVRWSEMSQMAAGPEGYFSSVKTREIPGHLAEKLGVDEALIRSPEEQAALEQDQLEARLSAGQPPAGGPQTVEGAL